MSQLQLYQLRIYRQTHQTPGYNHKSQIQGSTSSPTLCTVRSRYTSSGTLGRPQCPGFPSFCQHPLPPSSHTHSPGGVQWLLSRSDHPSVVGLIHTFPMLAPKSHPGDAHNPTPPWSSSGFPRRAAEPRILSGLTQ